jgi:hypothetical protein
MSVVRDWSSDVCSSDLSKAESRFGKTFKIYPEKFATFPQG